MPTKETMQSFGQSSSNQSIGSGFTDGSIMMRFGNGRTISSSQKQKTVLPYEQRLGMCGNGTGIGIGKLTIGVSQ
jgi:hypothetical protein